MKISIVTPDLSHNCVVRAYLLAKILQKRYEVEVVGPILGNGIWKPVADDKSIIYKSVRIGGRLKPYQQTRELVTKIDGDVIYVSKLLFRSFGTGLLKKFFSRKPLILDIDDWEMGFVKESHNHLSFPRRVEISIPYWTLEKLTLFADEITVSNRFLKERFGGTIVRHGRDTRTFDPEKFDKNLLREKYRVEKTQKVVIFIGTPRPNKGTDNLVKSISLIKDQDILLILVGADNDQYSLSLVEVGKRTLGNRFKIFGLQSFEKVPEFLAMADVVAIPQRKNFATIGQVPARVFDAMAMAKPTIATSVSDLPEILDGCGWIVEPENPEQLSEVIQYVLNNPKEAKEIGWKARKKCTEKYSWDAMELTLCKIFRKYDHGSNYRKNKNAK